MNSVENNMAALMKGVEIPETPDTVFSLRSESPRTPLKLPRLQSSFRKFFLFEGTLIRFHPLLKRCQKLSQLSSIFQVMRMLILVCAPS